jgi:uncharacterized heparinase superfamily protein
MTAPTIGTYWQTVRPLRVSQLIALARRRIGGTTRLRQCPLGAPRLRRPLSPAALVEWPEWRRELAFSMIEKREFRFLNVTREFPDPIPWSSRELSRPWLYHLNYFDFLNVDLSSPKQASLLSTALRLALDWRRQNLTGAEIGWEPYPLSLRIVNWLKFLLRNAESAERSAGGRTVWQLLDSLCTQTRTLERKLEIDLMANHLLKNAKALIFAGALIQFPESDGWLRKGEAILEQQLREQVLPDGGHFERSPMYHSQVFEDLLDLQALSAVTGTPLACDGKMKVQVRRMAAFLRDLLHPDGEIPLFGDSALNTARPSGELLHRAASVARVRRPQRDTTVFPDTGYAVMRDASGGSLVFRCGPLGPEYQPGHGHCDLLSYELSLKGSRVVVDTGVSTYERGPDRHYERSTCAHNTLRVDGEEQAEIWASFRVGRKPKAGKLEAGVCAGCRFLRGEHFGYQHLGVTHRRTIYQIPEGAWVVADCVQGNARRRIESFIHFHPDVRVKRDSKESPGMEMNQTTRWLVQFRDYTYLLMVLSAGDVKLKQSWYAPEFGVRQARPVIHWTLEQSLPVLMVYAFVSLSSSLADHCQINSSGSVEIGPFVLPSV